MILKSPSLDVVNDVRVLESRGARLANFVQGDGAHDDARDGDDEAYRRERLGGASFSLRHAGVRAVHFVHQRGVARGIVHLLALAMDVIRLVVVTEIAIRDTEDTLQVLDSLAIVGKVPATPARRRAHVEESVEELVRVGVRRVRTLSLDVAGDDAVHRLTLGLVVAVRRCGARLDRGVNLVHVLDDALRVHDSQLLLDAFVNVVQLVAILLLLADSFDCAVEVCVQLL